MTRTRRPFVVAALTGLAMISAGSARAADKTAPLAGKGCKVEVTGGINARWKGEWRKPTLGQATNIGASSDYWLTDGDLKQAFTALAGPKDHKAKKVEEWMKKDPKLILLLLNCITDEGSVFINPTPTSKYKDVPFGARSYKIGESRSTVPGQFLASSLRIGNNLFRVSEGTLDITKFDREGITGHFSLKADLQTSPDKGKAISVEGSFDFPCAGSGGRCRPE